MAALDVAADNLAATVDGHRGGGRHGHRPTACDVTSEASVNERVAALAGELGPPTVVCNVAGIGGFYNTVDMPTRAVGEDPGRQPDRSVPGVPGHAALTCSSTVGPSSMWPPTPR